MSLGTNNLVKITLHGHLGKAIGAKWNLAIGSVREAVHAINTLTKGKLYKYLQTKDKEGAQYRFLINERPVKGDKINNENLDRALETELVMETKSLFSIDIIPVIEGTDSDMLGGLLMVLGVVLIVVGLFTNPGLIMAGLVLVAGGVSMLLSKPPKFEKFADISQAAAGRSYFFGGAVNITTEGGPVPLGYGEAIVGSQVISAGLSVGLRTDTLPRQNQKKVPRIYPNLDGVGTVRPLP